MSGVGSDHHMGGTGPIRGKRWRTLRLRVGLSKHGPMRSLSTNGTSMRCQVCRFRTSGPTYR
jgi:hypothetical protein